MADAVAFLGDLFLRKQNAGGAADVQIDRAPFQALHRSRKYVAFFFFKGLVNHLPLGLADALNYHLFGGLGGDAAVVLFGVQGDQKLAPEFNVGFYFFGLTEHNVPFRIKAEFFFYRRVWRILFFIFYDLSGRRLGFRGTALLRVLFSFAS